MRFNKIRSEFQALTRDDCGVTLVEYGIALILAVAIGAGALVTLAGQLATSVNDAATLMP